MTEPKPRAIIFRSNQLRAGEKRLAGKFQTVGEAAAAAGGEPLGRISRLNTEFWSWFLASSAMRENQRVETPAATKTLGERRRAQTLRVGGLLQIHEMRRKI